MSNTSIKTYADLTEEEKQASTLKRIIKTIKALDEKGAHTPENDKVRERVRCECGRLVWDWVLVDCRHLPIEQDWACDGCWTDWQRKRKPIDGGEPIIADADTYDHGNRGEKVRTRKEWDRRWLKAHGAPDTELAAFDIAQHKARG